MERKYELTISTEYVPKWTYIEAMRELFQNAIDNEGGYEYEYNEAQEVLTITSLEAMLQVNSLLLGGTTKVGDATKLGQYGEGYKLAIMVLLREGKGVTFYNRDTEVWTTKLVNSKRFQAQVPTVLISNSIKREQKSKNLVITVTNISVEDYIKLQNSILALQFDVMYTGTKTGKVLLDDIQKGRIYVGGLYVCTDDQLRYGYDINPKEISLDRDRCLVRTYDLYRVTSTMWKEIFARDEFVGAIIDMVLQEVKDVIYITNVFIQNVGAKTDTGIDQSIGTATMKAIQKQYGADIVIVSDTSDLKETDNKKPIVVPYGVHEIIKKAPQAMEVLEPVVTLKARFETWMQAIRDKSLVITEQDMIELQELVNEV